MTSRPAGKRLSNKRGFGTNLRGEIVQAATRLLSESGSHEAVTLRAIAREAGIAAPSIYPHFADRDAILDVVVARGFENLAETCRRAADATTSGPARVEAISFAYVDFARAHPGQYRVLFERSPANTTSPPHPYDEGLQAFELLVQALGHPAAKDSSGDLKRILDAQSLFVALHGIATLPPSLPGFPWHDEATLVRNVITKISGG